jgi:signal transduction histidine kinase
MRYRYPFSRSRPSWWPENESWPPVRRMRHFPFFRRMGCIFLLLNLFGLAVVAGIITLVGVGLGVVRLSANAGQWLIPVGAGFALLVMLIVGAGVMSLRRVIAPLDDLLKAADQVGQGDYSARVKEKGPREVRSLARAFNDMASRLDQLDERRRTLLADVTHELRTPLTVVQGNLEGMIDGVYPADPVHLKMTLDETQMLSRLVDDLRTLALAESGALQLKQEPTDLALLVRDSADAFLAHAQAAGVTLEINTAKDVPWLELDPGRMRQVLSNLLANALRYTPENGKVAISYSQIDGRAILEVQDSGAGIPAEELPHIFERFYKSTDSGGMGLGLAIAKRLVEAHGGTISAENGAGKGTLIKISLPGGQGGFVS